MHFVFLNQYYPPDLAPTGTMLAAVVEALIHDGHDVTVICSAGGYAAGLHERVDRGGCSRDKSRVKRLRVLRMKGGGGGRSSGISKCFSYAVYLMQTAWTLLVIHPAPDCVVALTTPPYLSVLARAVTKCRSVFRRRHRRCDTFHCHWVMDLYPDVMVAHGMIGGDGVAARVLRRLTRWGFGGRRCKAVLTLGPDMADRLGAYVAPSRLSWIPLWGQGNTTLVEARRESDSGEVSSGQDRYLQVVEDVDPVDPVENVVALRRARGWGAFGEELVLMYSGNMGLGHYIKDFFALVDDGQNPAATGTPSGSASMAAMRLVFAGGGKRRKEVDAFIGQHPGLPIERMDYAPEEQLLEHLQTADVHLVSLRQEWDGTMVPSKLQGIFGVGRPVLFVGSETCAIGQWIAESGGGWIVAPGSAGRMRDVLEEMRDPQERARRAEAALAYAKANFNVTINGPRVAKCFSTGCL